MEYRWIEDIEEFRSLSGEWDRALIDSGTFNPFLLSDFIITWWKYFHEDASLRILACFFNNKIAAGLPLYLKRGRDAYRFFKILSHVGGSAANYTEPFYDGPGAVTVETLKNALSAKGDWDALYLSDVRGGNSVVAEYPRCFPDARFASGLVQDHMNLAVDLSGGKDSYLTTVSSKLKRDLRSKRKRLAKDCGELRLMEIRGDEELKKYFDIYAQFSIKAFKSRDRASNFLDDRYAVFFKEFLTLMGRKDRLYAHAFLSGDKVVAVSFAYKFGRGFNWILTSFNYDYSRYRPGYLLIEELIDEVARRGETFYNWYGHERFYKTQWCNREEPLYRFFLARRTPKGMSCTVLNAMENRLRSNKALVHFLRGLKGS